jgi:Ca-activated chloride channel family protein
MKRLHCAPSQTAFFLCLILFLVGLLALAVAQQTPNPSGQLVPERPPVDSIVLPVTVTDEKGHYVSGLNRNSFTLEDNKISQEINFFAGGDEPASIGIIVDFSGSMREKPLKVVEDQILRLVKQGNGANEYFLAGVANRPQLFIDWTRGNDAFEERLTNLRITLEGTNTALFDACSLAIEKMSAGPYPKRVILLISDGQDNNSRSTFKEVRERLKASSVLFYAIGNPSAGDPGSSLELEGQAAMDDLASISGGKAFFPTNKKGTQEVADIIAAELQHQYLLGFKPAAERADGKWHKIRIKATPSPGMIPGATKLLVRSREGYYADKNPR